MGISIDVCVATYRRPQMLEALLASLARQTVRGVVPYRIIVADNDHARSAEAVVTAFKESSKLDVVYAVEELQGISYARNRALRHATAPLVAFIDDDETASPGWLSWLMQTLDAHGADAVFGPVVPDFPASAPAWAWNHPAFVRPRRPTGSRVPFGATNNVLFRAQMLRRMTHWFDTAYARTGGEDTDFFARALSIGAKLVWCDEAEVHEVVPPERLTLSWVCRRAYRGGRTFFSIFIQPRERGRQVLWLGTRALSSFAFLLLLPFWSLQGRKVLALRLTRLCGWAGQLSQIFGNRLAYEEYRAARD